MSFHYPFYNDNDIDITFIPALKDFVTSLLNFLLSSTTVALAKVVVFYL